MVSKHRTLTCRVYRLPSMASLANVELFTRRAGSTHSLINLSFVWPRSPSSQTSAWEILSIHSHILFRERHWFIQLFLGQKSADSLALYSIWLQAQLLCVRTLFPDAVGFIWFSQTRSFCRNSSHLRCIVEIGTHMAHVSRPFDHSDKPRNWMYPALLPMFKIFFLRLVSIPWLRSAQQTSVMAFLGRS